MGEQRKTTDARKLSDEQARALKAAELAHRKAKRATAAQEGAIAARNDLIRQALDAGVGVTMLAKTLDLNGAAIWKIKRNLTTQDVARRREGGGG